MIRMGKSIRHKWVKALAISVSRLYSLFFVDLVGNLEDQFSFIEAHHQSRYLPIPVMPVLS